MSSSVFSVASRPSLSRKEPSMPEYKVEQLDGYGDDPDILDVSVWNSLPEADAYAGTVVPSRVAKVVDGVYYYRRYGEWTADPS